MTILFEKVDIRVIVLQTDKHSYDQIVWRYSYSLQNKSGAVIAFTRTMLVKQIYTLPMDVFILQYSTTTNNNDNDNNKNKDKNKYIYI